MILDWSQGFRKLPLSWSFVEIEGTVPRISLTCLQLLRWKSHCLLLSLLLLWCHEHVERFHRQPRLTNEGRRSHLQLIWYESAAKYLGVRTTTCVRCKHVWVNWAWIFRSQNKWVVASSKLVSVILLVSLSRLHLVRSSLITYWVWFQWICFLLSDWL